MSRGYLVGRREARNLVRHLHKRATGVYDCKEKPCPHPLVDEPMQTERPPQYRVVDDGLTHTQRRNAKLRERRKERAAALGITVSELRARNAMAKAAV